MVWGCWGVGSGALARQAQATHQLSGRDGASVYPGMKVSLQPFYVYIATTTRCVRRLSRVTHRWSPTSQLSGRELQCKLQCAATVVYYNKIDPESTLRIVLAVTSLYASGPLNRGASDVARKNGIGGTTSVQSLQQQLCRRARPFVRRDCFQSRASRPFPRIAA